jgi:hypothetical protein
MPRMLVGSVVYDTDNATVIFSFSGGKWLIRPNAYYRFTSWQCTLFRSESTGQWFVYAKEPWKGVFHNSREDFCPIEPDEAFRLMHQRNEMDLILEWFPDLIRDA